MDSVLFEEIVGRIRMGSANIKADYRQRGSEESINYVDIDQFFEVLYSLLKSNNYILEDGEESHSDKFIFTEQYPDIENDSQDIITYEIVKRTPANLASNAEPFKGTNQYRPRYIRSEKDNKDGGTVVYLSSSYDNRVRFRCWSTSSVKARRMATLLESIFQKYYHILRKYVPVMVLEGRGDGRSSNDYGSSRYISVPTDVFVRTDEIFTLKEQEIVCIEEQINL